MTAALVSSIGKVGSTAFTQMGQISPLNIENMAKNEKKWNESIELAAWRKYRELAGKLDQATVEAEMMRAVARTVEDIIRPRSR